MHSFRNIAIIGFMGAGKTTAGRLCASKLGMPFVDIDDVVEQTAGCSVGSIFATEGEPEFRRLEAAAIQRTASASGLVIATGGGAVLNAESRAVLRASCFCIWLRVSRLESSRRLAGAASGRPLWSDREAETGVRLLEREPLYRLCAHATVETDGLTAEGAAEAMAELWSAACGEAATPAKA